MSGEAKFEKDMARLEELVKKLEQSELGLEESLKAFEEGTKLAEVLTGVLEKAQERVSKLTKDRQGEFSLEAFGDDVDEED